MKVSDVIIAALIGLVATLAAAYIAKPDPDPSGETALLRLSPAEVAQGAKYVAQAEGFHDDETVRFSWEEGGEDRLIGDAPSKADGRASMTVHEGEGTSLGQYVIKARGLVSGRTATATLRVLPMKPPRLLTSVETGESDSAAGLRVSVTRVDLHENSMASLHVKVRNEAGKAVDLPLFKASIEDDSGRRYAAWDHAAVTDWPGRVSPGSTAKGNIALNGPVPPEARTLTLTFGEVFIVGHGFQDYVVTDIPLPERSA